MRHLLLILLIASSPAFALSDAELTSIGHRVWKNECGGTRDGLTSWNTGENFASLGIGHFIWYPKGVSGPFEESFPKLLHFLEENGQRVPLWMKGPCPWLSRAKFQSELRGPRMIELRDLLADTVRLQSRFLALRMRDSLPKMLAAAPAAQRENVKAQFERLASTGAGTFALIDYVNFKGEGTKETERYRGQGWGLLQVLSGMSGKGGGAAREFGEIAAHVLARRVQNAPPERSEERWLAGWKSRVKSYGD